MSTKSKIEICANSVESAVKAQEGGAYRVELCAGIPEGGTTPSFGDIRMARQLLQETKLHVIIRPRGGDFLYNHLEQEIMLHDIKVARQLGADGVVFGCLFELFNSEMENYGYSAMLYSSKNFLNNFWYVKNDYPVWLAHYTDSTDYVGDYDMWQMSCYGKIDGINADVDLNILYTD